MENNYITVVIPARNEENTIAQVIEKVKQNDNVKQIIVVNNNSNDNTAQNAENAGAEVIKCENQGKGYAMEAGMKHVKNNIVAFIDADINNYSNNLIEILTDPIIKNEADFVKSTFIRTKGGVVTEVAVKPLLNLLFPDMYKFSEPISGMVAAKKNVLEQLEFEKDYGVDIGILIDVIQNGNRVTEVNIGEIENMSHVSKTNETMSNMSTQIIRAILKRR